MKASLLSEEGFTQTQVDQIDKNMIYHKSVAEVRKNSAEIGERMQPAHVNNV